MARKKPAHKGHVPASKPVFIPLADLDGACAYPADGLPGAPDDSSGDWRDRALCAQVDPAVFYPEHGQNTREAKRICAACPVTAECLDYAIEADERFGTWGGKSPLQRRRMRERREQARAAAVARMMEAA